MTIPTYAQNFFLPNLNVCTYMSINKNKYVDSATEEIIISQNDFETSFIQSHFISYVNFCQLNFLLKLLEYVVAHDRCEPFSRNIFNDKYYI